jgi:hypothetical protein
VIAWVAGVAVGLPNAYLLAAIAAILNAGVGTSTQVGALVVTLHAMWRGSNMLFDVVGVVDAARDSLVVSTL